MDRRLVRSKTTKCEWPQQRTADMKNVNENDTEKTHANLAERTEHKSSEWLLGLARQSRCAPDDGPRRPRARRCKCPLKAVVDERGKNRVRAETGTSRIMLAQSAGVFVCHGPANQSYHPLWVLFLLRPVQEAPTTQGWQASWDRYGMLQSGRSVINVVSRGHLRVRTRSSARFSSDVMR